jgi:integrase
VQNVPASNEAPDRKERNCQRGEQTITLRTQRPEGRSDHHQVHGDAAPDARWPSSRWLADPQDQNPAARSRSATSPSNGEKAASSANLADLHFHDLRGTAIMMLSEAGNTPQQIASVTGHTIRTIHQIIEKYLARTKHLSHAVILNFENSPRTKPIANRRSRGQWHEREKRCRSIA